MNCIALYPCFMATAWECSHIVVAKPLPRASDETMYPQLQTWSSGPALLVLM